MIRHIFYFFSVCILLWACSKKTLPSSTAASSNSAVSASAAYESDPAAVKKETAEETVPSKTSALTASGKNIYVAKCGRCHGLKNTTDFTRQQWVPIMDRMAEKAKLSDTEKADVLMYVQANAKK